MQKRTSRLLVFMDGECSVCRVTSNVLNATDRSHCTEVVSFREDTRYRQHNIDEAAAAQRLHVIDTTTGATYEGFEAIRRLAREVLLLWPLSPVLATLAALRIGEPIYEFIARHRPTHRRKQPTNV